jgi:hypothetical protein
MNYLFGYSKAAVAHSIKIRRAQRETFRPSPKTSTFYRGDVTLKLAYQFLKNIAVGMANFLRDAGSEGTAGFINSEQA